MRIVLLTLLLLLGLSAYALAGNCCDRCCCCDDGGRGAAMFKDPTKLFGYDGQYKGRGHSMHEMSGTHSHDAPMRHDDGAPALVSLDATSVAYLDGDFTADMEQQFMRMVELAMSQGLVDEHSGFWGIAPDVISGGYSQQAKHWAAVSVASGMAPGGELQSYMIPGGEYLMMQHVGPHEGLEASWTAFFEWAIGNEVQLDGSRPALTYFASESSESPEAETVSVLYLPIM